MPIAFSHRSSSICYAGIQISIIFCLIVQTFQAIPLTKCQSLTKNSCQICYQYDNAVKIQTCKVACSYKPENGSIKCIGNTKLLPNPTECLSACCSSDTFQQCLQISIYKQIASKSSTVVADSVDYVPIIVCSTSFPTLLGIGFIIYLTYFKEKHQENKHKNKNKSIQIGQNGQIWFPKSTSTNIPEEKAAIESVSVCINEDQSEKVGNQSKLQSPKKQMIEVEPTPCAICLDCNYNLKTKCKHSFHINCFLDWLKRNESCPLCISNQYNPVSIQCQKCHQFEIICTLYSENPELQKYQFMHCDASQSISCRQCLNKRLHKSEQLMVGNSTTLIIMEESPSIETDYNQEIEAVQ